jgi:hypothetical protein
MQREGSKQIAVKKELSLLSVEKLSFAIEVLYNHLANLSPFVELLDVFIPSNRVNFVANLNTFLGAEDNHADGYGFAENFLWFFQPDEIGDCARTVFIRQRLRESERRGAHRAPPGISSVWEM